MYDVASKICHELIEIAVLEVGQRAKERGPQSHESPNTPRSFTRQHSGTRLNSLQEDAASRKESSESSAAGRPCERGVRRILQQQHQLWRDHHGLRRRSLCQPWVDVNALRSNCQKQLSSISFYHLECFASLSGLPHLDSTISWHRVSEMVVNDLRGGMIAGKQCLNFPGILSHQDFTY